jgi:hypothetical protein
MLVTRSLLNWAGSRIYRSQVVALYPAAFERPRPAAGGRAAGRLRDASQAQVAQAFAVDPATIWRQGRALSAGAGGRAGPGPARPKAASKLTSRLVA